MRKLIWAPVFIIIAILFASCSSADRCAKNGNYNIDYYSGGGFTGLEQGIIITCSGDAVKWVRQPGQAKVYKDKLKLTDDEMDSINKIIQNPALMNYKNSYPGNMTTNLDILKDNNVNKISFNGSDLPADMPGAVKNLITAIQNISK